MYLLHDSTMMDIMISLISTTTLNPGNLEDFVGNRSADLMDMGAINGPRQPPRDSGEIKVGIAISKVEQHCVENVACKLPGFVEK